MVGDATLNRFFAFHVIAIPLVLLGSGGRAYHCAARSGFEQSGRHRDQGAQGSRNGRPLDGIPFHPYYTVQGPLLAVDRFCWRFSRVLFFMPEMGGYFLECNNFIPADPLKTPRHIAPVWYFTPYYSILRATTEQFMFVLALGTLGMAALLVLAVSNSIVRGAVAAFSIVLIVLMVMPGIKLDPKFWGVVLMGASVMIFFAMPWLDHSPARSMRYRPAWHFWLLIGWVVAFLILGYLGTQPPTPSRILVAQALTLFYFAFFALMPWWSRMGTFKPVPDRITFAPH